MHNRYNPGEASNSARPTFEYNLEVTCNRWVIGRDFITVMHNRYDADAASYSARPTFEYNLALSHGRKV
jgi:hypothetical protein